MSRTASIRLTIAALLLVSPAALGAEVPSIKPAVVAVASDGTLLKDGQPYRGAGANSFDLLLRVLHDPANASRLPDVVQRLQAALDDWRRDVRASYDGRHYVPKR